MQHMRALPRREVASAFRKLRSSDAQPVALLAFEFLVLTATLWDRLRERLGELCEAVRERVSHPSAGAEEEEVVDLRGVGIDVAS